MLFLEPSLIDEPELPEEGDFSSEALGRIYAVLRAKIRNGENVSIGALSGVLDQGEMNLLVGILQKPELLSNSRRALQDYILRIREQQERDLDLNALRDRLRERKGYHS